MNAIPLTAPDGTVYAWACGVCHHVRAGAEHLHRNGPVDVKDLAETHREMAEDCCKCRRCDGLIEADRFGSLHCGACAPVIAAEMATAHQEQEAEEALAAAALNEALKSTSDRPSALALRDLMSGISEDYMCAGWLHGLEHLLWSMVQGGLRRFGLSEVSQDELDQLRVLHERCGGWWYWHEQHGEMFVTTADWLKRVEE